MNNKEFKDLVLLGIDKLEMQGEFSKDADDNSCSYNYNGLCCVVGHMMPNNEVREEADNEMDSSITSLYNIGNDWASKFTEEQIDTLGLLQRMHDDTPIGHFEKAISGMRRLYNTI